MNPSSINELDIRPLLPKDKHPTIFATFDSLQKGDILKLINDHDPAPLFYQLQATRQEQFEWELTISGPDVWIVNITKII